jgi:DNA helicase II / ATP-dependent DNA helicase PcrA
VSGSGENTKVEVRFCDGNVRKLILKYAGLRILD